MEDTATTPAAYCVISRSGKTFTMHVPRATYSGYTDEVFKGAPKGTPLIDFQTADPNKVMKAIFSTDEPREVKGYGIPMAEYLEVMKATGATIKTIQ